jgi:hypothetical protein
MLASRIGWGEGCRCARARALLRAHPRPHVVLRAAASAVPDRGPKRVAPASGLGVYAELSKARLSALVVMTSSAGYLAAGGPIEWATLSSLCVGTMLAAGSANTFNQVSTVSLPIACWHTCKAFAYQ